VVLGLLALLLLLATQGARCGPDDGEAASAVFLAAPVFIAVGVGLLALLRALWRPLRPDLRLASLPALVALAACLLLGVVGVLLSLQRNAPPDATLVSGFDWDLTLIALLVAGPSYLSLLLVSWRVWLRCRPASAFTWSWLPPLLVLLLPAACMLPGHTVDWLDWSLWLWMIPGIYGLPTAALLVGLVAEALVRRRHPRA